MLIKQPQVNIVSKIVRNQAGELVLAYFALVTIQGVTEAKFLGFKPYEAPDASQAPQEAVALLESPFIATFGETPVRTAKSVSTPFSVIDLLFNQLARAPSFN